MDRLDAVTIFVAVAEQGSFAAAARKLLRTPSAVTRAVAELEAQLNTRLLNRTTRSVALTEVGQLYLERARGLIAANAEFEGAAPRDAEPSGILNISAPANFGAQHLMPLVWSFLERHRRVDARVWLLDRVVSMVEEGIDVAVRYGRLPDSALRATKVFEARTTVYASPSYIARHGVPATPGELVRHSTISSWPLNPVPERWSFGGPESSLQVMIKPRLVVNTTEAAADAAAAGLGLAYLVSYQAARHLAAGQLVEVLAEYSVERIPFHIVQPAGRYTPPKVRAFIDEIGKDLRRQFG
jgi:DNA-binding transcriptional LysR family regulator